MNMKDMIQRMTAIEAGNKQLNEDCGMAEMPAMPPMNQGTPVSMNVSLNASGTEHVQDLINMMKNAGMGAAEPVSSKMLSPRMDMERMANIMGGPDMDMGSEMAEGEGEDKLLAAKIRKMLPSYHKRMEPEDAYQEVAEYLGISLERLYDVLEVNEGGGIDMDCPECRGSGKVDGETCDHCGGSGEHSGEVESADGGFGDATTEPDEAYQGTEYITKDLSGGLNRQKKAYAKAQPGDNAMAVEAIRAKLMAALSEKKAKPDADGDGVPDWADKKPGKDDNADKKGSKPKKGQVPPQFAKKK
jgi:hypothetical protein